MKKLAKATLASFFVLMTIVMTAFLTPAYATIPDLPTLDPRTIPKYVNQFVVPPVYTPTLIADKKTGQVIRQDYTVDMTEFYQQILPAGFPMTKVWGYGGISMDPVTGQSLGYFRHSPASTFETISGMPVQVTWINKLTGPSFLPVDPTVMWANPNNMAIPTSPFVQFPPGYSDAQSPVPTIPHLHGGEDQSTYDGGPEAWFTASGIMGPDYNTVAKNTASGSDVLYYPNQQPATTLWYHDHALGMTRLNVLAGLAGFYLIRDPTDNIAPLLPTGQYEIPIAIQDRSFNVDGSLWFPTVGVNPDIHPYWQPEFFGNTIMVNGVVWPNLNVQPHQYRFRVLDGSNARFYTLTLAYQVGGTTKLLPFTQIGAEGGYLRSSATMTSLTIAPGERADILVDFSSLPAGAQIIMRNNAKAPFPGGTAPDPLTTGQIMRFTVTGGTPVHPSPLPTVLNNIPTLTPDSPARTLVLYEVEGPDGPLMVTIQGQRFDAPASENPRVGSTEDWKIVDITEDAHPIHLHLVQFQVVSRQGLNSDKYKSDWVALNGEPPLDHPTISLSVDSYLQGKPTPARPNESGWKDTVEVYPGTVTTIRVRFAPLTAPTSGPGAPSPGLNLYPFDPTVGPGYVWHCHIVDHEDNEMMRPYTVTP